MIMPFSYIYQNISIFCRGYDSVGVCVYDGGNGYDVIGGCVYDVSSAYDDVGGCGFFLFFIHLQKLSLS